MDKSSEYLQVSFGPFSLGGIPCCLRRGSDQIKLRPMSLQVLRYLSERPGRFVGKDELLDQVWIGRVISGSGLRLCVGEIRAALDDDAKHPRYLETVVGKGYRFLEGAGGNAPYQHSTQPIVGRDAELRHLDDLYQSAVAGHTQFVLLAGEPGIGKTTLLNSFLDGSAKSHDARVMQGQCIIHYGKQEAYGPMLEALALFYRDHNDAGFIKDMERYAPSWLLQIPEMFDAMLFEQVKRRAEGMTPERMTREFRQLVTTLVEKRPLIIVVEDLHWADVSTVDLLASLAELGDLPLMILGTYRPADAVLYSQSLRNTVSELKGRGLCQEFMLELLTETDLGSYLAGRLNGEVLQDLIAALYPRTGGNPLFMVKLVEELIRTQAIVCHDGLWSINQGAAMETDIPESLQALILRNLGTLPRTHREMLEVASVVGMEFSAALIADALKKTVEEIESTCEKLLADSQFIAPGKLLTWPDGTLTGCYRFRHHLYLEVIYRQIAEARRARIHRKIGKRLEAGYGERVPEITVNLARHFDLGNDHERALRYGRLAAEQSLDRHAYLIAVDQLRLTLEHLEQLPESSERDQLELELLMLLGPVLIASGGYTGPGVAPAYQRAIKLCELLENPYQHFAALWNFAGYNMALGELTRSRPLIEKAVEVADGIGDEALDLMKADAFAQQLFFEGELGQAHDQAEIVVARYQIDRHRGLAEVYSQEDPGVACASIDAAVSWILGYPELSLERIDTVRRISTELGNPHSVSFGIVFTGVACQLRGDLQATSEKAEALITICNERDIHWTPFGRILKGWALARLDSQPEHLDLILQGVDEWLAIGAQLATPYLLALLAETQANFGATDSALSTLERGLSMAEENGERWFEAELYRLKGDFLLQQSAGHRQESERCFQRSLEIARAQQARSFELRTALSLDRLWAQEGSIPFAG